jgi:hypothetical protein
MEQQELPRPEIVYNVASSLGYVPLNDACHQISRITDEYIVHKPKVKGPDVHEQCNLSRLSESG